jgi:hypothetical protein
MKAEGAACKSGKKETKAEVAIGDWWQERWETTATVVGRVHARLRSGRSPQQSDLCETASQNSVRRVEYDCLLTSLPLALTLNLLS